MWKHMGFKSMIHILYPLPHGSHVIYLYTYTVIQLTMEKNISFFKGDTVMKAGCPQISLILPQPAQIEDNNHPSIFHH